MTSMHRFTRTALALAAALMIPRAALADTGDNIAKGLGVLIVTIIVFLLGREIVCWYYKINERNAILREIRDELRALRGVEVASGGGGAAPAAEVKPSAPDGNAEDPWT